MADRVVIVTGGGRGIGRAVCVRFAGAGICVVPVARTSSELEETARQVRAAGGNCRPIDADVSKGGDMDGVVARIHDERLGRVEVLVNAAGVAPLAPMNRLDPAVFETILAVNVRGVYHACRAAWGELCREGGVIVNVSSVAADDPFPGFSAYGASKAWVNAWSRSLAGEGRAAGVRVFSVAPGAVETKMLRDAFPNYPREQTLSPSDVAEVIFALASPACRYASGSVVHVRP